MRIERRLVFLHLPEMRVMQFFNAVDVFDGGDHGVGVHVRWTAQHECPDRPADLGESEPKYISGDTNSDCRINPTDIIEQDQNTANDNGDRRQRITEVVQEQSPDIHAAFLHRISQYRGKRVDKQGHPTQNDHRPAFNRHRIGKPHRALVNQIKSDDDQ